MTARVDLLAAAMYGHSRAEAEKLIDDYAHELAEQIRNDGPPTCEPGACCWYDAADLIDPELTP